MRLVVLLPMRAADAVPGEAVASSEGSLGPPGSRPVPTLFPQQATGIADARPLLMAANGSPVRFYPSQLTTPAPPLPLQRPALPLVMAQAVPPPTPGLFAVRPDAAAQPIAAGPSSPSLHGSAWLLLRDGGFSLTPGVGTLGASQAGVRLTYRVAGNRAPIALSVRVTAAIDRPAQSEAAVGIDWQPVASIPVHILAERRQRIGREGRSDFGVTVYGGTTRRIGPMQVDAYAQAGVVGRDVFADGAVRVTRAVGPIDVGAGTWGGAQPGASRVDAGPHVSARIPLPHINLRAAAEWRFRIAGDAAPDSGPAFTLATDF